MDRWITFMLIILSIFCLGQVTSNNQITAYVSGMAKLKCLFNMPKNDSLKDYIIHWQKKTRNKKDNDIVVGELFRGERNYKNLDINYKNRIMEIKSNGDLHMFNVTLEDEGDYKCFVQKNSKIEHNKDCKLNVLANFTAPLISYECPLVVDNGTAVTVRCSSTDGFPKPSGIIFTVHEGNITRSHHKDCNHEARSLCDIKNNSQTYNISGDLTLTVTRNISITCTVLAHHNVSSEKIHLGVKSTITRKKEDDSWMYILAAVTLVTMIGGGVYFGCKRKGKMCTSRTPRNETNTLTTLPPNNGVTQQPEESNPFMGAEADGP
ncbi:T-lymphocyte activation antigen CD80-like [Hyla sarda]|uniref:T-lymphocyte activation antigen CD80-like n=1 Tax=Hyla sarda TaxID=327740 RepID=UPI0024C346CB|nr:T-lymphocyte activation antigen CD80-like [Hyla sarda]XP_056416913.1 T-lymphocyte activation antigen CD80-like [Hyla sarda]